MHSRHTVYLQLTIKASSSLTSDGRSKQASAAAYEHKEAQRTSEPADTHNLCQHGDVDGDRSTIHQAVRCAESSQL